MPTSPIVSVYFRAKYVAWASAWLTAGGECFSRGTFDVILLFDFDLNIDLSCVTVDVMLEVDTDDVSAL